MYERIDHVEIVVRDLEKSMDFYRTVLDFSFVERVGMDEHGKIEEFAYLELGDTLLELLSVEDPAEGPEDDWWIGYRMMAVEVDDMDSVLDELPEEVDVIWGPRDMGGFKRAEIEDPNGLPIELREWKE
ncbi:lactoylglutathione lyase [candidate division MSBL1 archaeon SCGC-AAA382A20]|uniref:Lactoylglutathione lyase n=1 Tax=candidate division MSBL1 archaeon SCGC-AAA382A20 TaxID=1698280 RepID=A0A133VLB5_9EURY|nr:lactoylglutathione lyase [candidate division MSBL1 archaeon SCGC-AAA382A20]